jgi:Zn-dependent peptidase ImmA (M78 family)
MFRRGFKTSSEETSQKIRQNLGLASIAPIETRALARLLGIPILTARELEGLPAEVSQRLSGEHSDAWSALAVSDGTSHLIVINDAHSETRTNSSLAHEIAHVILGHDPSMMFVMPQHDIAIRTHNKEQEDEANWLAGCIVLPRDALLHVRRLGLSDDQICATYGVSPAMLRFRVNATGVDVQLRRAKMYKR